jgi:tRNA dimethylallyltransferase
VEVIRLSGKPFSQQRAPWDTKLNTQNSDHLIGLRRQPPDLRDRIDTRVERMFEGGLVGETKSLLSRGLARNRTASQALGYKQVIEHLHGARSLAETIELVKTRTRQFAKRQMTWFQKQLSLEWIELTASDAPDAVATKVAALVRASN